MSEEVSDSEIIIARNTADVDKEIADLYRKRKSLEEIGRRLGLASSSVGRRLGKMFKSGELLPNKRKD